MFKWLLQVVKGDRIRTRTLRIYAGIGDIQGDFDIRFVGSRK